MKVIVYYSYTGHTKMIVNYLARKLNCEVVELVPVVPYSTDYDTVVREEQNNDSSNSIREYKALKKDCRQYDEIILGTPILTILYIINIFIGVKMNFAN